MKIFMAILILSGYNVLPRKQLYWSVDKDVHNPFVANAMSRNQFNEILSCLHFTSQTESQTDKFFKLRPLIEHLSQKFLKYFHPKGPECDVDEAMIAYYGKHGCKQFIKGKPIRFGFKAWCLNSNNGYLANFDFYQGKSKKSKPENSQLNKGSQVILELLEPVKEAFSNQYFTVYCDNYFTSISLLEQLKKLNCYGTGTIRKNRFSLPICKLDDLSKSTRGTYSYSGSDEFIIVNWKDNSVVNLVSSIDRVNPVSSVKRYDRANHAKIDVSIPSVIKSYNKFMGGTDRMDQNISEYRISIRIKKWWWCLFTWLIDVTIQNCWLLARDAGETLDLLTFRRHIVIYYLQKPALKLPLSFQCSDKRVLSAVRYDNTGHLIIKIDKQLRCAGSNCTRKPMSKCTKCDVGLCLECFARFHQK